MSSLSDSPALFIVPNRRLSVKKYTTHSVVFHGRSPSRLPITALLNPNTWRSPP
jgi:hypothetical protein